MSKPHCMRCGKEMAEGQNFRFCEECLVEMEKNPVKPGTPIQLPKREETLVIKRGSFRLAVSKWQDKIFLLKYIIFWLVVILILLAAALALCICMLLEVTPDWINNLFFEHLTVAPLFMIPGC